MLSPVYIQFSASRAASIYPRNACQSSQRLKVIPHTPRPSFVEENPTVCHSERSEAERRISLWTLKSDMDCSSFVEDNPTVCHSERSGAERRISLWTLKSDTDCSSFVEQNATACHSDPALREKNLALDFSADKQQGEMLLRRTGGWPRQVSFGKRRPYHPLAP